MQAILSPNPKRIKTFILNGKVYEGGYEEAIRSATGDNLGGTGGTNGVQKTDGEIK